MKTSNIRWKGLFLFIILGILVVFLAACGGSDSSTSSQDTSSAGSENSPSDKESDKDTGESPAEVIDLAVSSFMPGPHPQHTEVIEPFLERVEEATEGRVTGTLYPANALGAADAHYDLAVTGAAGMSMALHSYTPGEFPLTSVSELPFMGKNAVDGTRILWALHEEFPEIAEEHQGTKIAWIFKNDPAQILTVDKPIHHWKDLDGMRIRTPSPAANAILEAYGAVPISMPMGEVYEAMQRGVVDGALAPASVITNFQLGDVTNYITRGNFYTSSLFVVINEATWERISPEDQAAIEALMGEEMALLAAEIYDIDGDGGWQAAEEAGIEIYDIPADELDQWMEPLQPIYNEWVESIEAQNLPGRAIYERAVELRDQGE